MSLITSAFKVALAGTQTHVPWPVSLSDCQDWGWHLLCQWLQWWENIGWDGLSSTRGVDVCSGPDLKLTKVLGGPQEPAWSPRVNFTGHQLCILHFCGRLRGSRGHHGVYSHRSVVEGSANLDVSFCCPCRKLRRHGCLLWLSFLASLLGCLLPGQSPRCRRLLLYEEGFCVTAVNSHWRASNTKYNPLPALSVIRMYAQRCMNASEANYICCI